MAMFQAMKVKPPAGRGKTLTARLSCKTDAGGPDTTRQTTLAPPMSSVIVERHQPIVKVSLVTNFTRFLSCIVKH